MFHSVAVGDVLLPKDDNQVRALTSAHQFAAVSGAFESVVFCARVLHRDARFTLKFLLSKECEHDKLVGYSSV
jgi:hypothetical protein